MFEEETELKALNCTAVSLTDVQRRFKVFKNECKGMV